MTFDDKEGTTSTKENDAPLRVNRKHLQLVGKRDNKLEEEKRYKKKIMLEEEMYFKGVDRLTPMLCTY